MTPILIFLETITIIYFGLMLGSFAGAVSYRVPRGQSWVKSEDRAARSACPSCKTKLGLRDLVPIFSWVLQKGRCRYCTASISARYPIIEGTSTFICLGIYGIFGFGLQTALLMLSVPFVLSLVVVGVEHQKYPRQLIILSALTLLFAAISFYM